MKESRADWQRRTVNCLAPRSLAAESVQTPIVSRPLTIHLPDTLSLVLSLPLSHYSLFPSPDLLQSPSLVLSQVPSPSRYISHTLAHPRPPRPPPSYSPSAEDKSSSLVIVQVPSPSHYISHALAHPRPPRPPPASLRPCTPGSPSLVLSQAPSLLTISLFTAAPQTASTASRIWSLRSRLSPSPKVLIRARTTSPCRRRFIACFLNANLNIQFAPPARSCWGDCGVTELEQLIGSFTG